MFSTAASLVRSADKIASPPRVFQRVNEIVNDPDSTTEDIARVIAEDAGITLRLLRVVNSAFFGYQQKIDSLDRAVMALGTRQVRDLVLATTVADIFEGLPSDLINMDSFWRHSLACGVMARSLAQIRQEMNLEPFFLGGVLHDVGRLVMFSKMPGECREIVARCLKTNEVMQTVEREVFGYDHAEVGGCLLSSWGLPPQLEEAVASHHLPQRANRNPMLASVVHIADVVVNALKLGNSGVPVMPKLSSHAWSRYGMAATILSPAIEKMEVQYRGFLRAVDARSAG
ncbi:MAG TPA: HDOD domain-containing protein [Verrucomicrobiae bacterium]|nr:HDOD domain-containing protein [Verrucomicrobiae bacterium]